jgi:cysteine desulfurase
MHAPKGIGALWIRRSKALQSLLRGGAQERRRRAGTENVPLAAAFARAADLAATADATATERLRDRFEQAVLATVSGARVNGIGAPRLPNTSNILFEEVDAEGLVIGLDLEGIAVSTGSACSSGRVEPSHVLLAMGLSVEDARSSVRFSLSRFSTDSEIERLLSVLTETVPRHHRKGSAAPTAGSGLD